MEYNKQAYFVLIGKRTQKKVRLLEDVEDLVVAGVTETLALCRFFHKGKDREIHVDTRGKSEHLLHLDLQGVHEE